MPYTIEDIDAKVAELVEVINSPDWVLKAENEGCKSFSMQVEGFPINYTLGVSEVNCGLQQMVDLLNDIQRRSEWDELFVRGEIVEAYERENTFLTHLEFSLGSRLVSNRDTLAIASGVLQEDGSIVVVGFSTEDERVPPGSGRGQPVRAFTPLSGFHIVPILGEGQKPEEATKVVLKYMTAVDPNGNIPKMVVNVANTKPPLCARGIARLFK